MWTITKIIAWYHIKCFQKISAVGMKKDIQILKWWHNLWSPKIIRNTNEFTQKIKTITLYSKIKNKNIVLPVAAFTEQGTRQQTNKKLLEDKNITFWEQWEENVIPSSKYLKRKYFPINQIFGQYRWNGLLCISFVSWMCQASQAFRSSNEPSQPLRQLQLHLFHFHLHSISFAPKIKLPDYIKLNT